MNSRAAMDWWMVEVSCLGTMDSRIFPGIFTVIRCGCISSQEFQTTRRGGKMGGLALSWTVCWILSILWLTFECFWTMSDSVLSLLMHDECQRSHPVGICCTTWQPPTHDFNIFQSQVRVIPRQFLVCWSLNHKDSTYWEHWVRCWAALGAENLGVTIHGNVWGKRSTICGLSLGPDTWRFCESKLLWLVASALALVRQGSHNGHGKRDHVLERPPEQERVLQSLLGGIRWSCTWEAHDDWFDLTISCYIYIAI